MKYTVYTSISSPVIFDLNGLCIGIEGPRRVKDVYVEKSDGTYEPIDVNKTYKLASRDFTIKSGEDGITQFIDNKLLMDEGINDYQSLITYLVEYLNGVMPEKYFKTEGRITIE